MIEKAVLAAMPQEQKLFVLAIYAEQKPIRGVCTVDSDLVWGADNISNVFDVFNTPRACAYAFDLWFTDLWDHNGGFYYSSAIRYVNDLIEKIKSLGKLAWVQNQACVAMMLGDYLSACEYALKIAEAKENGNYVDPVTFKIHNKVGI